MHHKRDIQNYIYKIITSSGSGSGFNIKGYGYITTNWHVVDGYKEVAVETRDKRRYLGKVVMVNPHKDIALIRVYELSYHDSPIELDKELKIENGQKVCIGGYPFGMPFTITQGIISSSAQIIDNQKYIQTDAAVNPGNSGGAMLNEENKLVGVVASKFTDADNIGFAIPYSVLIDELESYKFREDKFRVRCSSCGGYIEEKSTFCQNCGGSIKEGLFDEKELTFLESIVYDALIEIPLFPVLCSTGSEHWEFYKDDILIRLFKINQDIFGTYAPLCKLPQDNLDEILKEITSDKFSRFKIAIEKENNNIAMFYRFYISDLNEENHRKEIIHYLSEYIKSTKKLSEYFIDKYGCEKIEH